jgi:hypothetical protein
MNKMIDNLNRWHQTKPGLLVFALLELALTYGFGSLAIDRGTFWWFLLALIFLLGSLQNLAKLIGKLLNGNKAAKA